MKSNIHQVFDMSLSITNLTTDLNKFDNKTIIMHHKNGIQTALRFIVKTLQKNNNSICQKNYTQLQDMVDFAFCEIKKLQEAMLTKE